MASIDLIRASNGSGDAVKATVTNARVISSTTLQVDATTNWPSKFIATVGDVDGTGAFVPATVTVFDGILSGSNIEITSFAPGYTDIGNTPGQIVVLKPTTEWANNVVALFDVAHNDDGTLKDGAVDASAVIANDVVEQANLREKLVDYSFDFVASGCVWSGDAYASTLNASMTAGVVYIGGKRVAVSAVTARAFTASKDTYIDVSNTGTITYTEVANNATSPTLAANSIRIGIIVTGASNIANVGSVNQGQENKVLPIASSIPYTVTDSLGNLLCPRDPNRKVLGYRQITSNFDFTTLTDITGLSVPFIAPGSRKVKAVFQSGGYLGTVLNDIAQFTIKESSTVISASVHVNVGIAGSTSQTPSCNGIQSPSAGLHTYKVTAERLVGTGTNTLGATTSPAFLMVELA